jgi:Sulfotransferase family
VALPHPSAARADEPAPDLKVLFIMGRGRSGSTVLDNLLGQIDGFVSVGELHNLFKRGLERGYRCGCGRTLSSCAFWRSVLSTAFGDRDLDAGQVVRWQNELVSHRRTHALIRMQPSARGAELGAYVDVLKRLYSALGKVSGARVVVDSSKRPAHGALLHLVPGITPYFVHLVRDPRAVVFSRQRAKSDLDRAMRRDNVAYSALTWNSRNRAADAVRRSQPPARSLLTRYEDFAARPREALRAVADLVGEHHAELPLESDHVAHVGVNHTASGNPSRFNSGTIAIRSDDQWRTSQSHLDRLLATIITLPSLRRYGYPLRVSRPPKRSPEGAGAQVSF